MSEAIARMDIESKKSSKLFDIVKKLPVFDEKLKESVKSLKKSDAKHKKKSSKKSDLQKDLSEEDTSTSKKTQKKVEPQRKSHFYEVTGPDNKLSSIESTSELSTDQIYRSIDASTETIPDSVTAMSSLYKNLITSDSLVSSNSNIRDVQSFTNDSGYGQNSFSSSVVLSPYEKSFVSALSSSDMTETFGTQQYSKFEIFDVSPTETYTNNTLSEKFEPSLSRNHKNLTIDGLVNTSSEHDIYDHVHDHSHNHSYSHNHSHSSSCGCSHHKHDSIVDAKSIDEAYAKSHSHDHHDGHSCSGCPACSGEYKHAEIVEVVDKAA